jgi:hypothetical protein
MALHSNISMEALLTMDQCYAAADRIESSACSYTSPTSYRRGAHCVLTKGAAKKIASINKKADKLFAALDLEGDLS